MLQKIQTYKKRLIKASCSVFLCVFLLSVFCVSFASASNTASGPWHVTYEKNQLTSDFNSKTIANFISNMQPGDSDFMEFILTNNSGSSTKWYLENKVIKSLEDGTAASGGAYTYILIYTGVDGKEKKIYSSETVGGETENASPVGLHEADAVIEDTVSLGDIPAWKSGKLTLKVALDGESQGNNYQTSAAEITLRFVVDVDTPGGGKIVKTGDDANLTPFYAAMLVSGILFLILALNPPNKKQKRRVSVR